MKTIRSLILFTLLAAAACTREDLAPRGGISFIASLDGYAPATKAAPILSSNLSSVSVGLIAYTQEEAGTPQSSWQLLPATAGGMELVFSQVHGTSDPGRWVPKTDLLWPRQDKFVRFYAYAPYGAVSLTTSGTSASGVQAPYLEYTVPTDLSAQQDILFAASDALPDNPAMDQINVSLTFSHILSALRFRVPKGAKLESVKIAGVYGKGIFASAQNWRVDKSQTFNYNLSAPAGSFLSQENYVENSVTDPVYDVLSPEHTFMVLPQDIPSGATIEVNITTGSGTAASSRKITAEIGGETWKKGCVYIYDVSGPVGNEAITTFNDRGNGLESYQTGDDPLIR